MSMEKARKVAERCRVSTGSGNLAGMEGEMVRVEDAGRREKPTWGGHQRGGEVGGGTEEQHGGGGGVGGVALWWWSVWVVGFVVRFSPCSSPCVPIFFFFPCVKRSEDHGVV